MSDRRVINDRYELRRSPLARGGMGEVWEGRDTKLDRDVAVKFVRVPDGVPEDELLRRFARESRITARLQHPGVPAVFDFGTDGERGRPYLVMQRVRGTSVSDLLAEHERLPVGWAASIAAQTCAVLAVAHDASLVHRDLKPSNLMVESDGTVKVLDFGLAMAMDLTAGSQITASGQPVGTPAYMAPEQVLAGMSGPRTDLYALGCTLHEMLTGTPPFRGATSYSLMNKQVEQLPPSVRDARPELPEELAAVVRSLLAKEPEERPDSAETAYDLLIPFVVDVGELAGIARPLATSTPARMYAEAVSRTTSGGRVERPTPPETFDPIGPPADEQAGRLGTTRPDLSHVRAEAADLRRRVRYGEAAQLLGDAVESAGRDLGDEAAEVVDLRLEWADTLFEAGDYRRAAPIYDELVERLSELYGTDSDRVLQCRRRYATCLATLGDTEAALPVMRELLEQETAVHGTDDVRTIELRRQIGTLELGAGRREDARATLQALRDDLVRSLGDAHPDVRQVGELLAGIPRTR